MGAVHNPSRRFFLRRSLIAATGLIASSAFFPQGKGYAAPILPAEVLDGQRFRDEVMPRALLSIQASQLAVDKARQNNAREFAGFELMEAITVVKVLGELGTGQPPMSPEGKAFIESLKTASGEGFDKMYMKAELSNHEFLRDLATRYLQNENNIPAAEQEIKHLATLALFAFKEHVAMCKRIYSEVNA